MLLFIVAAATWATARLDRAEECSTRAGDCLSSAGEVASYLQAGATFGSSVLQLKSSVHDVSQVLQLASSVGDGNSAKELSHVGKLGKTAIPCSIHQTWKTSDISQLTAMQRESLDSFIKLNPECTHKLWSDEDVDAFIKEEYPELSKFWSRLEPIQRADLFRYAVILKKGGVYADLDVKCLKPIKDWGMDKASKLVVGYETGYHLTEKERKWVGFARSEQFEQWLFAAVPEHPVLRKTLDLFLEKYQWIIGDTIELTGPGLFSDAVHGYLFQLGSDTNDTDAKAAKSEVDSTVVSPTMEARPPHQPLRFPPGWKNNEHIFIFSADKVASPGFSTNGISSEMIIRHGFEGTWKEAS